MEVSTSSASTAVHWLLFSLLMLCSLPGPSLSILLCGDDCLNNTNLEICQKPPSNTKLLDIMAFFPCNTPSFRARGLTVAAQLAAKNVVKDSSLLSGYKLNLVIDNTMCDHLAAIRAFIKQLQQLQNGNRYMIIGPGCSVGAALTAENAPFYSLSQIGYTSSGTSLSDRRLYPTFLRTISSDNASVATVQAIVREYGWEQVALVALRDDLFSNLTRVQTSALQQDGVSVVSEQLSFDPNPPLEVLEAVVLQLNISGARVVLLNILESQARTIFCLAYKRGMTYPRYTFISYYWYSSYWWTDIDDNTNCTVQELTDAIFRSLSVDHFPSPTEEEMSQTTDVGYNSPTEFWSDFKSNIATLGYLPNEAIRQAAYVYDAVWTAAFALNSTSNELQRGAVSGANGLEDFNHFVNESLANQINEVILRSAKSTEFRGVSGKVKFNQFGDREPTRKIYQYLFTEEIDPNNVSNTDEPFASVDGDTVKLMYFNGQNANTVFPVGVTMAALEITIPIALFIVYTILACLGVVFAVACIIFNLVFRKKQIVKLSSPYLNVVIISGAILFYIDVVMFGLDVNFASFEVVDILRCQFSIWLASVGFSLLFGTMLAKTWRVYYIFKNIKLKKRPLKDWILFLIVLAMVALDVVFLVVVSVDIFRLKLQSDPLQPQPNGEIPHLVRSCRSDSSQYWIPVLMAYKALYLLIGIFLAVQTYNVKLKRLRDSKLIVACVFTISVVSVVAAVIGFTVTPSVSYGVYGFFILAVVTAILFILFGTLMIELWKNPTGEATVTTLPEPNIDTGYLDNTSKISSEDQAKINELKATILSLKEEIDVKRKSVIKSPDHAHLENELDDVGNNTKIHPRQMNDHVTDHVTHPSGEKQSVQFNSASEESNSNQLELQVVEPTELTAVDGDVSTNPVCTTVSDGAQQMEHTTV